VDLRRLVDETMTLARNSDEVKPEHQIVVVQGEEFPEQVEADAGQIRQVFWNLVRNALAAMDEGGTLRVLLEAPMQGQVAVVFEDDGCGFDQSESERLFEPFHSTVSGGSGLGLAIVYRIVKEHGGRVLIDTRKPRGARVRVELPVTAAERPQTAPAPEVEEGQA
jgi:signal transduction histidine kinase